MLLLGEEERTDETDIKINVLSRSQVLALPPYDFLRLSETGNTGTVKVMLGGPFQGGVQALG